MLYEAAKGGGGEAARKALDGGANCEDKDEVRR